jgi:hypothetical protein
MTYAPKRARVSTSHPAPGSLSGEMRSVGPAARFKPPARTLQDRTDALVADAARRERRRRSQTRLVTESLSAGASSIEPTVIEPVASCRKRCLPELLHASRELRPAGPRRVLRASGGPPVRPGRLAPMPTRGARALWSGDVEHCFFWEWVARSASR